MNDRESPDARQTGLDGGRGSEIGERRFWPLSTRFNRVEAPHSPLRGAVAVMADIDDGEATRGMNADHVQ